MKNIQFTCKKCKRILLGKPNITASAPDSEGFKDVKLCCKCYWETVGFWNGDGDRVLQAVHNMILELRENHSTRHSDELRVYTEGLEDFLKHILMFDGNILTKDRSAQLGKKFLDDFGWNYWDEYGVTGYDEYGEGYRYRFDAYIEFNNRKVGIEFDGDIHSWEVKKAKDEVRDENLRRNGYIVLRFTENHLLHERSYVRSKILNALYKKVKPPQLSEISEPIMN